MEARREEGWAAAALVLVALLFGTSFVVVKRGLDHVDPTPYIGIRFVVGALLFLPFTRDRPAVAGDVRAGLLAGSVYFGSLICQTVGLRHTTASTSAFLTYLLVVMVPLLLFVRTRLVPAPEALGAVVVAVAGLALLTGGGVGFGMGEALTVLSAVGFAYHLLQVGEAATRRYDAFRFNAAQCVGVAVPAVVLTPFTGGFPSAGAGWAVGVYAGVVITFLAMLPWMWAQRHVPPARASLILLMEPVFAAVAAYATGERLRPLAVVGAGLILAAAVVSETVAARRVDRPT